MVSNSLDFSLLVYPAGLATADFHGFSLLSLSLAFASVTPLQLITLALMLLNLRQHRESVSWVSMCLFAWRYNSRAGHNIVLLTIQFLHEDYTPAWCVNDFLDGIHAPSSISLSLDRWNCESSDPMEPLPIITTLGCFGHFNGGGT